MLSRAIAKTVMVRLLGAVPAAATSMSHMQYTNKTGLTVPSPCRCPALPITPSDGPTVSWRSDWPSSSRPTVMRVTKREGEDYETFVRRAAANPIGREVKMADFKDNCDLSRIVTPTQLDYQRIKKYHRAIKLIEAAAAAAGK
jgi:hypothetical protein